MKKISVTAIFLLLALLCGCTGAKTKTTPAVSGIHFTAEITLCGEYSEYDAEIKDDMSAVFGIISPSELEGLSFEFSGTDVTEKYNGLEYKTAVSEASHSPAPQRLYGILRDIKLKELSAAANGDDLIVTGKNEGTEYSLVIGATGLPISLETDDGELKVYFKKVRIL